MKKPTFPLSDIYTASTASKEYGVPYSTIKDDLNRKQKFNDQIKRGLVQKEGRVWLITRQAIQEVYDK